MFVNFLKSIFSLDDSNISILLNLHTKMIDDIIFDVVTIELYLNKSPNKFSAGADGISTKIVNT